MRMKRRLNRRRRGEEDVRSPVVNVDALDRVLQHEVCCILFVFGRRTRGRRWRNSGVSNCAWAAHKELPA
jgi:hypothetical protein